jgi:hypothetical protein
MQMRTLARLTFGVLAVVSAASTASADVHLTIRGGRVTLIARDATLRQILAEWERVGQTKVINADRIAGGPLNLELTNVPEQQALDVLLRSVSGVVLAPRAGTIDNLSAFERISVMPPSIAPQPLNNLPPAIGQAPFQQPRLAEDDQDDRPTPGGVPQNRGPVFVFPQPQNTNPQLPNLPMPSTAPGVFGGQQQQPTLMFPQPAIPGAFPQVIPYPGIATGQPPVGVSVPGMVAPAAAPMPGQPGFPPPPRPQNP